MKTDHPHHTLARALWSAIADADEEALRLLLADDVRWHAAGRNPLSGEFRGPDEVLDYLAAVGESADELSSRLDQVYVNDDGAVVIYRVAARRGGRRLDTDYLMRLRVRDGVVVESTMIAFEQRENDDFWS